MNPNTKNMLILIREGEDPSPAVEGIVAAVCPYLGTFGEQATISSTEHFQALKGGEEGGSVIALRLSLAGQARVDFGFLIAKLQHFLKQTAKDADASMAFEVFCLKPTSKEATARS